MCEKINGESKIIGLNENLFLVTNTPNTTLADIFNYAAIVDSNGKQITEFLPIGTLTRDDIDWLSVDIPYNEKFSKPKIDTSDALLGFAIGDAFGVPVEFLPREEVKKINLKEMVGNDSNEPLNSRWGLLIPAGSWSDDTSMLISSMDSIVINNGNINYNDIMARFLDWAVHGVYTSFGKAFGIGNIVYKSLERYTKGVAPLDCGGTGIRDNGNGSLMRILPFSLFCIKKELSEKDTADLISAASSLTHAHDISKMSCFIYTEFLRNIIETKNQILSLERIQEIDYSQYFSEEAIKAHRKMLKHNFKFISEDEINSSGYVVDTLESVIYSIINSKNFEAAIETSVSLGYDTDTVGGITGSIAGILYGKENIPNKWLNKLKRKDYLIQLSKTFDDTLERNLKESNILSKN